MSDLLPPWDELSHSQRFWFLLGAEAVEEDISAGRAAELYEAMRTSCNETAPEASR